MPDPCPACGAPVPPSATASRKIYCSARCRGAAYHRAAHPAARGTSKAQAVRTAVLRLLAAPGARLTLRELIAATGAGEVAVRRAVTHPWFVAERVAGAAGGRLVFGLSAAGREELERIAGDPVE